LSWEVLLAGYDALEDIGGRVADRERGKSSRMDIQMKSPNLPLSPMKQTPILSALSAVGNL
jgi:hypothetical protein